jgi:hypothetical protein
MAHFYDKDANCHNLDVRAGLTAGFLPSVTTILGCFQQEHLTRWHCKNSVDKFIETNNRDEAIRYRNEEGATFGSIGHKLVQRFLLGDKTEIPGATADHVTCAMPIIQWLAEHVKDVILVEHRFADAFLGYGGTMDLVARLRNGKVYLIDYKFKKHSDRYPAHPSFEHPWQLAAYRAHLEISKGRQIDGQANLITASTGQGNKHAVWPWMRCFDYGNDKDSFIWFQRCQGIFGKMYKN